MRQSRKKNLFFLLFGIIWVGLIINNINLIIDAYPSPSVATNGSIFIMVSSMFFWIITLVMFIIGLIKIGET